MRGCVLSSKLLKLNRDSRRWQCRYMGNNMGSEEIDNLADQVRRSFVRARDKI